MTRLPDETSYGARPSLRSNRIDMPDQSGLMLADSLQTAAATFAKVAEEKKQKDDRLNYSLAKSELVLLDIQEREKLKTRDDYEQFDESYTSGFTTGRDQVLSKYRLSESDAALIGAESNLIRERGRVNVGDFARGMEMQQARAKLDADLDLMMEQVQVASPADQNELMMAAMESIMASTAAENGRGPLYSKEEGQNMLQKFVATTARGSLESMTAEDRIEELKLSLAHRKARGAISPDDIRDGKGSGSIADFLHKNIASKMLELAEKENDLDKTNELAYAASDEAFEEYQGPGQQKERLKHIADKLKGNPDARAVAERLVRLRNNDEVSAQNAEVRESMREHSTTILDQAQAWEDAKTPEEKAAITRYTYDDIPADIKAMWSPLQKSQMEEFSNRVLRGKYFADTSNMYEEVRDKNGKLVQPAYSTWSEMSNAEKAAQDLTEPMWYLNFTEADWRRMNQVQDVIRSGKGPSIPDGLTNQQLVSSTLLPAGKIQLPQGKTKAEKQMYFRTVDMLDQAIQSQQQALGRELTNDERREELAKVQQRTAFPDRDAFWFDSDYDEEERKPVALMKTKELDKAFLPYEDALKDEIEYGGQTLNLVEYLEAQALKNGNSSPSKDQIERAYMAWKLQIGGTPERTEREVIKRLTD